MDELGSGLAVKGPQRELSRYWPIVAAAFIGTLATSVHAGGFGVLMAPLHHEFGWSRTAISLAIAISALVGIPAYLIVGFAIDRIGARKVVIPALVVHGLLLAALAFCGPNVLGWWIGFALLGLTVIAAGYPVWSAGVAACFEKQRGLALGLALAGSGLSAILSPIATNTLALHFGWRSAFFAYSGLCLLVALPAALLWFKPPPSQVKPNSPVRAQFFAPEVWRAPFAQISASLLLMGACLAALLIHFVPLAESMGLSSTTAAALAGLIGVGSILGRVTSGSLLDIYKLRYVGAGFCLLPIIATALILLAPPSVVIFSIVALVVGSSLGTETNLAAYAAGHFFPRERYGVVLGLLGIVLSIGTAIGAQVAAIIYDRTGSYNMLCMAVAGLCACGAVLMFLLPSASTARADGA